MFILVALVPLYVFIPLAVAGRPLHTPALPLDGLVPVEPVWALVYGALYLFLILLPVFVVRQPEPIRRTVWAYLFVWITAYLCFLAYPTAAPRPPGLAGHGFASWGLRFLYEADPPFNCFPSLHVAHSFVSALAVGRVHRRLGSAAVLCASLVAVSTLFSKQHYVLDVVAGAGLAALAHAIFLRGFPRDRVPALDRRLAPAMALLAAAVVALAAACFWLAYRLTGGSA